MKIGDKYKLEADTMNLILYKRVTQEQITEEILLSLSSGDEPDTESVVGEDVKWKRCGFFSTMEGVLTWIINNDIREQVNLESLETIVAGQRELAFLIQALDFKGINLTTLKQPKPTPTADVIEENTQEKQE